MTGGLGYVGARFAELVAMQPDYQLTLTTRKAPPDISGFEVVRLDPADGAALTQACHSVDTVIQLAGMNAAQSNAAPAAAETGRISTTRALLAAAVRCGVRRVIHVSTVHVYGRSLAGIVVEEAPLDPMNAYAHSHIAAESLVRSADAAGEIEGIVARLSNSFGAPAYPSPECWALATNALCRQAAVTGNLVLQTRGTQKRDFVPMVEACRALLHLATAPRELVNQSVYNVGSGRAISLLDQARHIADAVMAQSGRAPQIVIGDRPDAAPGELVELSIGRLHSSGFEPDAAAGPLELQRLARHCLQEGA
ncbi:MAG: SDR family oxidoreductase [Pseudomonadota bacterium]